MRVSTLVLGLSLTLAAAPGCKKGGAPDAPGGAAAGATGETGAAVAVGSFDIPFKGTYLETAKVAWRNNRRIADPSKGASKITIEPGRVTYHVEYPVKGKTAHVTETYSFDQSAVRTVTSGFDINMKFEKMDSDTDSYNPDSLTPKLEARRAGAGWQIGFLYRDTKGVQAGVEFR